MDTTIGRMRRKTAARRSPVSANACASTPGLAALVVADGEALIALLTAITSNSHPMTCKGCRSVIDAVAALVRRADAMPVRPIKRLGKAAGA